MVELPKSESFGSESYRTQLQHRTEPAFLLLEDGSLFEGRSVSPGTRFGEVVFNTSMSGYQEIVTDPSYRGQIVVMTQPHIGNYGTGSDYEESRQAWVEGFIVREFTQQPSGSLGSTGDLGAKSVPVLEWLRSCGVPAVEGIDTRAVVRRLREHGSLRGVLTTGQIDRERLLEEVRAQPPMTGRALVDEVTCDAPWTMAAKGEEAFHLAVYDFGVKTNILRCLAELGARLTILPARTSAADCLALEPDGIVLSNGPGDPEPLVEIIAEVGAAGRAVGAAARDLPRPSVARARSRRPDLQAQVRPSWREPAGA